VTPAVRIAALIVFSWALVALISPLQTQAANEISLEHMLERPALGSGLGRDDLGRPIAARLGVGAQVSLLVAMVVVSITASVGIAVGVTAAWLGGWVDLIVVRIIDVFLAFPGILLAIALSGILGPGLFNLLVALSAVGWVGFARLARAQTLSVRQRDHVAVARALGVPAFGVVVKHILPLIAGPLLVEATFALSAVIVAEAGLSFLGLGVQPPAPSWGAMIRDGTRYMLVAPHFVLVPGLALMSLVIAINLLGDELRRRWQVGGER
jgi:peptide/nickel transport system permease protein